MQGKCVRESGAMVRFDQRSKDIRHKEHREAFWSGLKPFGVRRRCRRFGTRAEPRLAAESSPGAKSILPELLYSAIFSMKKVRPKSFAQMS
jgi:hypothetical protein